MTESLTREQFATALADAIAGVLTVYREVDTMFRDLTASLADGKPRLTPLARRVVPNVGKKNPDARYLRHYRAALFVEENATDSEDTDDEDDVGDEEQTGAKRALTIRVGASILVVRATIYDRAAPGFEPTLSFAVLSRCRPEAPAPSGAMMNTKLGRLKKLLRVIDAPRIPGQPIVTPVNVQVLGQSKGRSSPMVFDGVTPVRNYPLFDIDSKSLPEILATVRSDWS